jgi:hypothetical protein
VPSDTGGFVVTLGNDTLSAESFTHVGDRIEGLFVRRSPRTVVVRYVMTLSSNGMPARLEYNIRLPDGAMLPNGARTIIATFSSDSVITEIVRDESTTRRVSAGNAYPEIDGAVSFYALPIAALRAMNRDSARFVAYPPGATQWSASPVARRGPNRYWVYSSDYPIEVVTDATGRILSVDASRTTLKIQSRRQGAIDIARLAHNFAERERIGGAMTDLSPRDSVIATVGSARLSIDYGRPATRGRIIWGPNGVLGDTLWRTGANKSTSFTTTAPLTIGGRSLPAGTYSLMTLAVPDRYHLIFFAGSTEVLRVPLTANPIAQVVERFTLRIEPAGNRRAMLRMLWDSLELSTPILEGTPE